MPDVGNLPKTDDKNIFPTLPKLNLSEVNFNLNDLITETANNPVVQAVETVAPGVGAVVQGAGAAAQALNSVLNLNITELPVQIDDFAKTWYHSLADAGTKNRINRFNASIKVLQELENGQLELPQIDGMIVDGKQLANDIKNKIIKLFVERCVDINIEDNVYHQAFFGHCAERVLENLKFGEFVGTNGFVGQKPEIADIIINRVNEIFTQLTLGV